MNNARGASVILSRSALAPFHPYDSSFGVTRLGCVGNGGGLMADAHLLWQDISIDEQVNQLSDRDALIYTWALAHIDGSGRLEGSPPVLRAKVVPLRFSYSVEDVEQAMLAWTGTKDGAGKPKPLVDLYSAEGKTIVQFRGAARRQRPLRRLWREPASELPPPPNEEEDLDLREPLREVRDGMRELRAPRAGKQDRPVEACLSESRAEANYEGGLPDFQLGKAISPEQHVKGPIDDWRSVAGRLSDADDGTPAVLAAIARGLPEAATAQALESLEYRRRDSARPPLRSEVRYFVASLKRIRDERAEAVA